MRVLYDAEGDALYIPLRGRRSKVDRSVWVDDRRIVDLGPDDKPIGIEVLGASRRFALTDLGERFELGLAEEDLKAIERHWFQPMQYAPPFTGGRAAVE